MTKTLHFSFIILLINLCHATQIDLCLSGSGNEIKQSDIKYLPDSSRLYIVSTDSRDGIFSNDSAQLYLIKTDKSNTIQFVHPFYYDREDTTGNSTDPGVGFGGIYINDNEIFVSFIAGYLYYPTYYYRYKLNYEVLDYDGHIIKRANNVASVLEYDASMESTFSLDEEHVISPAEGNYSTMFKVTFNSHGYITETFPFFKIINYELASDTIFGFENNSGAFSHRTILPIPDNFVLSYVNTDHYEDTPGSPSVTVINANGNLLYDTILCDPPHSRTLNFSYKGNLFFTLYSSYTSIDSLGNPIVDSVIGQSYLLDYGNGFHLREVRYKHLPVSSISDNENQFLFVDPSNISYNQGSYLRFTDMDNSFLLSMNALNDSTIRFALTDVTDTTLPEIFSFNASFSNFTFDSISYNTFILPDSSLLFIYKMRDNIVHMVKFNAARQLISATTLPVSFPAAYDRIYFNYFPIGQKLLAQTEYEYESFLYSINYADTISPYKDTLLLDIDTENPFECFQDNIGNIYAYAATSATETDACFPGTYDVIIYKIPADTLVTVVHQTKIHTIRGYPNPTSELFFIDVSNLQEQDYLIKLYDNNGRFIKAEKYNKENLINFNVHDIVPGIYELVISSGKEILGNIKVSIIR